MVFFLLTLVENISFRNFWYPGSKMKRFRFPLKAKKSVDALTDLFKFDVPGFTVEGDNGLEVTHDRHLILLFISKFIWKQLTNLTNSNTRIFLCNGFQTVLRRQAICDVAFNSFAD